MIFVEVAFDLHFLGDLFLRIVFVCSLQQTLCSEGETNYALIFVEAMISASLNIGLNVAFMI